ncbi:MAG: PHP domain-containing protein [Rhizobiales bacterium]|nr:PHP domain-containing protein [Hyphomicrobiales bacterium]
MTNFLTSMFPSLWSSAPVLGTLYAAYTAAFYLRVSTAKATNPIVTSKEEAPDRDALFEYRGLIHVHSDYSHDARGSYDELSRDAHRHGLAFLVITDHNNVDAIAAGEQGWRNGALLLTGVESKQREGYMLFVDIESYIHENSSSTRIALQEYLREGGFGLVIHAGNCRRPWKGELDPAITGLEILDYADQLYDCSLLAKLNAFLFYPANRALACLRVYHRPTETLARWDGAASTRPVVGFYGPNMHQNVRILGWEPRFPPADAVMPLASNHILSREPLTGDFQSDRRIVYTAIRNGNLFFALDILGDSNGFRFSATQESRSAIMGETLAADIETNFSVRLPRIESKSRFEIVVYRDGVEFLREKGRELTFRATQAGAYRVEVLAKVPTFFGGRMAPWIYSNPIYLRS